MTLPRPTISRVTDEGKREIVGRGSVIATYGSFVVNASPDRYFYQPGGSAVITVEARDYDLKPVRPRIHVELFRWNWRQRSNTAGAPLRSADVDTGADGTGIAQIAIPTQGGSYRLRVSARTPEGRQVRSEEHTSERRVG